MFIRRSVIASIAHILILISVVEGTCTCKEVCPNWSKEHLTGCNRSFLGASKSCSAFHVYEFYDVCPDGICLCNFWGCNCDGCGNNGQCGCEKCTTDLCINNCNDAVPLQFRDLMEENDDLMEENDTCKDFKFFMSLSPEEKKEFLGDKYCEGGTPVDDIFKKMLKYVDSYLDTNSINLSELRLSCDDFNASTYNGEDGEMSAIGRKLKLCKNNGNKKGSKKNKKRKNKNKK